MQTTTEWNNNKILKKQTIVLALGELKKTAYFITSGKLAF